MRTLTVKLSEDLFASIAAQAEARRITKSAIVRERLAVATSQKHSVWDAIAGHVSDFDRLPRDLSSNKAHMKRYGRSRRR